MKQHEFGRVCARFWDEYLSAIATAHEQGLLSSQVSDPIPSFPQTILIGEFAEHFTMELIGGRRRREPLKTALHKLQDINLYFGQLPRPTGSVAMMDLSNADHSGLAKLALVTAKDRSELDRRFPGVGALYGSAL